MRCELMPNWVCLMRILSKPVHLHSLQNRVQPQQKLINLRLDNPNLTKLLFHSILLQRKLSPMPTALIILLFQRIQASSTGFILRRPIFPI